MTATQTIPREVAHRMVRLKYEGPRLRGKALTDAVGLPDHRTTFLALVGAEPEVYPHIRLRASAEEVVAARDGLLPPSRLIDGEHAHLRWDRIAARAAISIAEANALYDSVRGMGAAKRSYTGRGRRFPNMD